MNIGERLKMLREGRSLSGIALARRVGVVPSQISKIENGVTNPSFELLERICIELDVTLAEFFAEDSVVETLRENVIAKFDDMNLNAKEKTAAEIIKSMPINEQQASFLKVLNKFKSLSASDQEALIKIINSLPSQK